jgi:polar amino acid transport system permease protein
LFGIREERAPAAPFSFFSLETPFVSWRQPREFQFSGKYWQFYLIGAKNTILLAILACGGRPHRDHPGAGAYFRNKVPRFLSSAYVEFIRGTPLLVQLFVIYYGLQRMGFTFPDLPFLGRLIGMSVRTSWPGP